MKLIATLVLFLSFAVSSLAEGNKTPIGSLPCKNGCVMLVQEYLSKAKMPQKVVIASPAEDVYAFTGGKVTKVLEIDNRYSVFIERDNYYYVYNNLVDVAVTDGDRLDRGDHIGFSKYDRGDGEYQMEMQIWHDNGSRTVRLSNNDVVSVLKGTPPAVVLERARAKARAAAEAKRKAALKAKYAKKHKAAKKSKYTKSSKYKKSSARKKTTSKAKKPVAKKKTPVKKKR